MKFSYTARIILAVGIFAVAVIVLYQNVAEQGLEQAAISTQVAVAQSTLPKLVTEEEELQNQLSQLENDLSEAENQLDESKASFPRSTESIEYDTTLFQLAHEWDLDIVSLMALEPQTQEIAVELSEEVSESANFMVTFFTVEVKGKPIATPLTQEGDHKAYLKQTVANILDFVNALINHSRFTSTTFELVRIDIPEPLTDTDPSGMGEEEEVTDADLIQEIDTASAIIRFIVYHYEGD